MIPANTASTRPTLPVRVPQAQRTAAMKQRLCKAAFEQIRDHGYVNFKTAAVTRLAGVSQGAYMHHFPTKSDLALATMAFAYEEATATSLSRIEHTPADSDPISALVEDARQFFFSAHFRVVLDILMCGGNDEALRQQLVAITVKYRGKIERAWLEKLVDHGWSLAAAEDVLAMTLSLARGFAMRLLVEPDPAPFDAMMERWKKIACAQKGSTHGFRQNQAS